MSIVLEGVQKSYWYFSQIINGALGEGTKIIFDGMNPSEIDSKIIQMIQRPYQWL